MYLPLFEIAAKHQFFTSGMHRTFTISPTAQTETLAAEIGLSSRQTPNGIRVFYESQRLDILQQHAGNPNTPLQLGLKLTTEDRLFDRYTEPNCPDGSLFYFDQLDAQAESSETYRLHGEAQVSASDMEPLASPRIEALLDDAERSASPLGVISISLTSSAGDLFDAQLNVNPRTYQVRFAARKTYWTYYLLGNLARDGLYLEDANNETEFEALGEVSLPGNRIARAFRSTSRLPLQDRYPNRFQIIDPDAIGDRVLVARLPYAQVRQTYQERLNGTEVDVSEIFIDRS